jgi:ribokinase
MEPVRFVAIGELLVDVLAEGSGHDARIRVEPGGSAFNAGVAAVRAGADATVFGSVGDDAAGRLIVAELEAGGVRVEVAVSDGATGTFLFNGGAISVDRGVSRAVALPDVIEADVVLVSGYLPAETIEAALARTRAPWAALDAARLEALPPGGSAVVANEDAARRLTGLQAEEAAHALSRGRRLACVTLGARGAVAVLDGRVERLEPAAVAADSPGTGDVFAATLLVALARGAELAEALGQAGRAVLDSFA